MSSISPERRQVQRSDMSAIGGEAEVRRTANVGCLTLLDRSLCESLVQRSTGSVQAAGRSLSQDTVASFYRARPQSRRNWRAELALRSIGIPGREPPNSGSAGLDHKGNLRPAPGIRHFPFKVSNPRPFPSIDAAMLAPGSRWRRPRALQSIRTLAAA
jgi:hypothetical protein